MSETQEQAGWGWRRYVAWALVLLVLYPLSAGAFAWMIGAGFLSIQTYWRVDELYWPLLHCGDRIANYFMLYFDWCQKQGANWQLS